MSYGVFLLIFLGTPIAGLLAALRGRVPGSALRALALTGALALLYTAPWDNALIRNHVWSFGRSHVLGVVLGVVPLEEYLFYLLQVTLTGLLTLWLLRSRVGRKH